MTLFDAAILNFLFNEGYTTKLHAAKIQDISLEATANALYKRINSLCKESYIAKGLAEGHAHTYYLTTKGIEFYKENLDNE